MSDPSDKLTPQEMENFWEYNYKRLHTEFELYKVRHQELKKNYYLLLQRVYKDDEHTDT